MANKKAGAYFRFKNIDGTTHKGKNLTAFCRKHGLDPVAMFELKRGVQRHHLHKWFSFLPESQALYKRYKTTIVNLVTGERRHLNGPVSVVAPSLHLDRNDLYELIVGRKQQLKGWVLETTQSLMIPEDCDKKSLDFLLGHGIVPHEECESKEDISE